MTAWPFNLFHFQAPSFTLTVGEEMVTSMEIAIGEVQEIYARVFSNSNEKKKGPPKEKPLFSSKARDLSICGGIAGGLMILTIFIQVVDEDRNSASAIEYVMSGFAGGFIGTMVILALERVNLLVGPLCGAGGGLGANYLVNHKGISTF